MTEISFTTARKDEVAPVLEEFVRWMQSLDGGKLADVSGSFHSALLCFNHLLGKSVTTDFSPLQKTVQLYRGRINDFLGGLQGGLPTKLLKIGAEDGYAELPVINGWVEHHRQAGDSAAVQIARVDGKSYRHLEAACFPACQPPSLLLY